MPDESDLQQRFEDLRARHQDLAERHRGLADRHKATVAKHTALTEKFKAVKERENQFLGRIESQATVPIKGGTIHLFEDNTRIWHEMAERLGLEWVDDYQSASIVASQRVSSLMALDLRPEQFAAVYTREPLRDYITSGQFNSGDRHIEVFNLWSNNHYFDNFVLFPKISNPERAAIEPLADISEANRPIAEKSVAALLTYRPELKAQWSVVHRGEERGKSAYRVALAKHFHDHLEAEIFGDGWPEEYSAGSTRKDPKRDKVKKAVLEGHNFNLCLENTVAPYYVTEKIWDSIRARCLPIYFANETIYDDFPEDSFVDCAKFDNMDQIVDFVRAMDASEYVERLNKCIATFNRAAFADRGTRSRHRVEELIEERYKAHRQRFA